jgi:hypothetical protein
MGPAALGHGLLRGRTAAASTVLAVAILAAAEMIIETAVMSAADERTADTTAVTTGGIMTADRMMITEGGRNICQALIAIFILHLNNK